LLRTIPFIVTICLVNISAQAQTSRYIFLLEQSRLVQTGGIAGVQWTYAVEGQFLLTVDSEAGTASFTQVDANAVDDSPLQRTLDPNEVFNMTALAGTIVNSGKSIQFEGSADDASSIQMTLTFADDAVTLKGQTTPPPNSADFFIFALNAAAQRKYSGGTGELNEPYQIATAGDLMALGDSPEDYDKHFILTADIDLDPNLPGRKVFDKAVIAHFNGFADGNGHAISHLVITGKSPLGLFGQLRSGAEVWDLGVVDVKITGSGFNECAGLVGDNRGSVIRCYSSGIITGDYEVGGLLGHNGGVVIDCYTTCSVTGSHGVGGLVGNNQGAVFKCYSACSATGSRYVGGLAGVNLGNMINCYSTGTVMGNEAIGGLAGTNGYCGVMANPGYIDKSYSLATVKGETCVGGLVGDNFSGDVTQCYSKGTVNGDSYVGGLVGALVGTVTQCYSTGAVSGDGEYVGGLVGAGRPSDITASFWDTQTSGQSTSFGGIGKTTVEMQTAGTFLEAGWDFSHETANGTADIWSILEGEGYPRLYWELIDDRQGQTGPALGKASNPDPADGAVDVEESWSGEPFELAWTAGLGAVAHNVYFGTDLDTVSQSNIDSKPGALIFQNLVASELRLWTLERDKIYYWRIDEVGGDGTIVTGEVWSFTTALRPSFWKGRACFTGDTPVWIDGNLIPISKVVSGQVFRCGDDQSEVGEIQVHDGTFTCYDIVLESGNCITVAECHYFMTVFGQWLAVHDLKTGTRLKTEDGDVSVTTIARRPESYEGKVFNLRVKGSDRYLVGKDAIVVRDY
jgi:hypothetical protein